MIYINSFLLTISSKSGFEAYNVYSVSGSLPAWKSFAIIAGYMIAFGFGIRCIRLSIQAINGQANIFSIFTSLIFTVAAAAVVYLVVV